MHRQSHLIKWMQYTQFCSYAISRLNLTVHFMCVLMSNLVICKFSKRYGHTWHRMSLLRLAKMMVIHDTECPYWDQMSLKTKKQQRKKHKFNPVHHHGNFLHAHVFDVFCKICFSSTRNECTASEICVLLKHIRGEQGGLGRSSHLLQLLWSWREQFSWNLHEEG